MSYYDHATMMAHRLGPWADDTMAQHTDMKAYRGLYAGQETRPSLKSVLQLFCARMPAGRRVRQEPVPSTGGDAPRKT